MTSTSQPRFHYAWTVLAAVTFVLLTGAGVRSAIGVFIQPMEAEFGWPRTTLSAAVALSLVLYGAAGPVMGRLADRWGPRGILTAGSLLVGVGTVGAAFIQSAWQLFLTLGIVAAIGAGAAAAPVAATAVTRWFETRRGLVLGFVGAGMAGGQLLVLPLAMALASLLGWRHTYLVLGLGLLVLAVPVAWVFVRNDPAERGLRPFGAAGSGPPVPVGGAAEAAERTPLGEAVRTWPFILLAGSFWVCGYTTFGLMLAHFIPHATEHGFAPVQAAQALGIMGAMNIVGTIFSGWLCDRYGPKLPLALYYLFRGLSLFWLPMISTTPVPLCLRRPVRAQLHLDRARHDHAHRAHLRAVLGGRALGLDLRLASDGSRGRVAPVGLALRPRGRLHTGLPAGRRLGHPGRPDGDGHQGPAAGARPGRPRPRPATCHRLSGPFRRELLGLGLG